MKVNVRLARMEDLQDLCLIRFADRPEVHLKRIRQSESGEIFYLVAELDDRLAGYGLLLLKAPSDWLDANSPFPRLIDLYVSDALRGQGIGRSIIERAEELTRHYGYDELNLSVAPLTNPRALQLYQRLGYSALQDQPYLKESTTQSDGRSEPVGVMLIDLHKVLNSPAGCDSSKP